MRALRRHANYLHILTFDGEERVVPNNLHMRPPAITELSLTRHWLRLAKAKRSRRQLPDSWRDGLLLALTLPGTRH